MYVKKNNIYVHTVVLSAMFFFDQFSRGSDRTHYL